jgi:hypothetical protein
MRKKFNECLAQCLVADADESLWSLLGSVEKEQELFPLLHALTRPLQSE